MAVKKARTNYEAYKDKILDSCSQTLCCSCLARNVCAELCVKRKIDTSKDRAPCLEAWHEWADREAQA